MCKSKRIYELTRFLQILLLVTVAGLLVEEKFELKYWTNPVEIRLDIMIKFFVITFKNT